MGAGLAKPMVQMNDRNLKTAILAEGALSGDPLSYFRSRMAEPPPKITGRNRKKNDKIFKEWQNRQMGLRSDLVRFINGDL